MSYRFCLFLVAITLQTLSACNSSEMRAAQAQRTSKIAPELVALHEEYASHAASGSRQTFRSNNPLLQIVDGRVAIDAVAAEDSSALQADLIKLGLRNPAAFGRIVSGQLPISSIPALATLPSLNFARAAAGITHKGGPLPKHR